MSHFKAKVHEIRFRLGLRLRPYSGSKQRSPRPPRWISEGYFEGKEGRGREEGREGKERGKGEGKVQGEGKWRTERVDIAWPDL